MTSVLVLHLLVVQVQAVTPSAARIKLCPPSQVQVVSRTAVLVLYLLVFVRSGHIYCTNKTGFITTGAGCVKDGCIICCVLTAYY